MDDSNYEIPFGEHSWLLTVIVGGFFGLLTSVAPLWLENRYREKKEKEARDEDYALMKAKLEIITGAVGDSSTEIIIEEAPPETAPVEEEDVP